MKEAEGHNREKSKDPTRGLKALNDWYQGEAIIPLFYDIITQPTTVRALPRGVSQDVTTTLHDVITNGHASQWWQRQPEEIRRATKKDPELQDSMHAMSEIIESIQKKGSDSANYIPSLALLARAVEIDEQITPHIPTGIYREIAPGDPRFQKKSSEKKKELVENNDNQVENEEVIKEHKDKTELERVNLLQKLRSFGLLGLSSVGIIFSLAEKISEHSSRSTSTTHNKSNNSDATRTASAFTSLENYIAGRDRYPGTSTEKKYPGKGGLPKDTVLEYNTEYENIHNAFAILHVANIYDNQTGQLTTKAEKLPIKYAYKRYFSGYDSYKLISHMKKEDISLGQSIAIPNLLQNTSSTRASEIRSHNSPPLAPTNIDIFSKNNRKILVESSELEAYLRQDSLGNLSIALEDMPLELRWRLSGHDLAISAEFEKPGYDGRDWKGKLENENIEWIGPIKEDEQGSLLYPNTIKKLIQTMGNENSQFNLNNTRLANFATLAQFIGDNWLTYDELDAPRSDTDPIGFMQTDRVLNSQIASCEGANIALGEIMRHFIGEKEGIAYVKGFVLEEKSSKLAFATPDELHLKVLFKDEDDEIYVLDATPWRKDARDEIKEALKTYSSIKKDWYDLRDSAKEKTPLPKTDKEIHKEAQLAWNSLFKIWATIPKSNKLDYRPHAYPGYFGSYRDILPTQSLAKSFTSTHLVPETECPLDSSVILPLNPVPNRLFKYGFYQESMNPQTYIPKSTELRKMDRESRLKTLKQVADLSVYAQHVTIQNTEIMNEFTEHMLSITDEYKGKFKNAFLSVQDKLLGGDVEKFFNEVPFMLLLDNPLEDLTDFFTTSYSPDKVGTLLPSTPEEIADKLENSLISWREDVENSLKQIKQLLQDAPLTVMPPHLEIELPSLRFWEESKEQMEEETLMEEKRYLDPINTFNYLYKTLYENENED